MSGIGGFLISGILDATSVSVRLFLTVYTSSSSLLWCIFVDIMLLSTWLLVGGGYRFPVWVTRSSFGGAIAGMEVGSATLV